MRPPCACRLPGIVAQPAPAARLTRHADLRLDSLRMPSKRRPARSAASSHVYAGHTGAGAALTELVLETFRLYGALIAAGDRMTAPVGLTAARWQVLSSVAQAPYPAPVAHVAREMGLTRQSVQRLADQLVEAELLAFEANPHHKRAPLVVVTT